MKVDTEGIAEEWAQGLHLVERRGGKVMVFDARAQPNVRFVISILTGAASHIVHRRQLADKPIAE